MASPSAPTCDHSRLSHCTVCGWCAHDIVLNGACLTCGSRDLPQRNLKQRAETETLISAERLVRKSDREGD